MGMRGESTEADGPDEELRICLKVLWIASIPRPWTVPELLDLVRCRLDGKRLQPNIRRHCIDLCWLS